MKHYLTVKRILDIVFSLLFLCLASPLLFVIALAIKICSPGGPALYSHKRIGKDGKTFSCWKFRTMVPKADQALAGYLRANSHLKKEYARTFKLKQDPRIIKGVGRFLRNSSLDELPQFFNVLKGDMSVVGPRPITEPEIKKYGKHFKKLVSVRPGITGLWQISGRNDISYEQRVDLDMQYISHLSLRQDLLIGLKTIGVILLRKGY